MRIDLNNKLIISTSIKAIDKYLIEYSWIKDYNRRHYAAMVASLDEMVGEVVDLYRRKNLLQNTLAMFVADNGGETRDGGNNWPLSGQKWTLLEGGVRATGFLFGGLAPLKGRQFSDLWHVTDIMPTFLEAAGCETKYENKIDGDGKGNIYIVGRGDPSLTKTQLKSLAEQLKEKGIENINQLIADDTYFQGIPVNPNWEWEDVQAGYGAPINSLIFNQNAIDLVLSPQGNGQPLKVTFVNPVESKKWQIENNSVTVATNEKEFVEVGRDFIQPIIRISGQLRIGSASEPVYVAVVEPVDNFLNNFRQVLELEGIRVSRIVKNSQITSNLNLTELAFVESPTVGELIEEVNKKSNNIYAEALLRQLGVKSRLVPKKKSDNQTLAKSLEEVKVILTRLGVTPNSFRLNDGSGLSRHNLISPEALVQTLRIMANSPWANIYRNSLAVGGVSGTLSRRFRNSFAEGNVQAKTGTMSGISGLSGYVEPIDFEPLVFSIIVNQSDLETKDLRTAIDKIVLLLTQLKFCG